MKSPRRTNRAQRVKSRKSVRKDTRRRRTSKPVRRKSARSSRTMRLLNQRPKSRSGTRKKSRSGSRKKSRSGSRKKSRSGSRKKSRSSKKEQVRRRMDVVSDVLSASFGLKDMFKENQKGYKAVSAPRRANKYVNKSDGASYGMGKLFKTPDSYKRGLKYPKRKKSKRGGGLW